MGRRGDRNARSGDSAIFDFDSWLNYFILYFISLTRVGTYFFQISLESQGIFWIVSLRFPTTIMQKLTSAVHSPQFTVHCPQIPQSSFVTFAFFRIGTEAFSDQLHQLPCAARILRHGASTPVAERFRSRSLHGRRATDERRRRLFRPRNPVATPR